MAMDRGERHFERFPVEHIEGELREPGDVHVLDLSQTGLAFSTPVPLESGERRELELKYRGQRVRVEVMVRWAKPEWSEAHGRAVHRVGAEFERVLEKEETGLWDFILAETEP